MNTYIADLNDPMFDFVLEYDHKEFMAEIREESKVKFTPEMNGFYGKTHSEEVKKKMQGPRGNPNGLAGKRGKDKKKRKPGSGRSGTLKGAKWWNDGTSHKRSESCPGREWVAGRINLTGTPHTHQAKEKNQKRILEPKKGGIKPPLN